MRLIRIVGPCLVAVMVVAIGVLAASASAQLRPPVWYECAKTAKEEVKWTEHGKEKHKSVYTGVYLTNLCKETEKAPAEGPTRAKGAHPGPEGKYELKAGTGEGKRLTGTSEASKLRVKSPFPEQVVECERGKVEGGLAEEPNRVSDFRVAFKKCSTLGKPPTGRECHSTSPEGKNGEIKTKELEGELGWVNESPAEPGLRVEAAGEEETVEGESVKPIAKFVCGFKGTHKEPFTAEVTADVYGQLIGAQTEDFNAINKDLALTYVAGENYGTHEYEEKSFKPLVNIIGWASETEGILQHQEENKEQEDPAHVLRGTYCGSLVKLVTSKECTPLTFSALEWKVNIKGSPLMVKEEE